MTMPYQPSPQPTLTQPSNGMGTAGFVLGLIGLVFSPIPIIGVIAWPLVILGLIFSLVGFSKARKGRATNKGLALAGVVCSAVGLVICIVWLAAFGEAANQASKELENVKVEAGVGTADDASEAGAQSQPAGKIGEPVRDGAFEFTVTKVEPGIERVGDEYVGSDAQGQYVIVHLTVRNVANEAKLLSDSDQKLVDAQGRTFDAASGEAAMSLPNSQTFLNNINPGNSVDGQLLYDVPKGAKLAGIQLHDSMFSDGVTVSLGS